MGIGTLPSLMALSQYYSPSLLFVAKGSCKLYYEFYEYYICFSWLQDELVCTRRCQSSSQDIVQRCTDKGCSQL